MTTGQGLLPYTIEVVDDDATLTGHAGLPLVLETMRALGVSEVLDGALGIRRRNHGATDAQKAEALVLLMAAGGSRHTRRSHGRRSTTTRRSRRATRSRHSLTTREGVAISLRRSTGPSSTWCSPTSTAMATCRRR